MGSILSTNSPVESLPFGSYLGDVLSPEDTFESLASNRFMKVVKARTSNTLVVYKVFGISEQDDSKYYDSYREAINKTKASLSTALCCCTIKHIFVKPKYALLVRPYQKYTLHERIATRPFLSHCEKNWLIYQLFRGLSECQKAGVTHGDLKTQNILLSSSNWLQITDFAPFKPTFLPYDNPTSFDFFFDTSRKDSCYLAPERFLSSADYERTYSKNGDSWLFSEQKHAYDMFSAGCVVFELLCDGRVPFTYGELCNYKKMSNSEAAVTLERLLAEVALQYRPLLKMLLNREPSMRMTAEEVLKGSAFCFPDIVKWLFNYLNAFRPKDSPNSQSMEEFDHSHAAFYMDSDDIIAKLKRDEKSNRDRLERNAESKPYAVLLVSLISANLRSLKCSQSKVDAIGLLVDYSQLCEPGIAIGRVLPYLVHMLADNDARIKATALHAITSMLQAVEPCNLEETLVFIDYVFPELNNMVVDKRTTTHVLNAIAMNLGLLAETALKYLNSGKSLRNTVFDDECSGADNICDSHDEEKLALNKLVTDIFQALCNPETQSTPVAAERQTHTARHCLMNADSLSKLYVFFNRMGCSEILPNHIITFMNVKADWRLRALVFDSLPICVQKRTIRVTAVKPLLQQGLHDFEQLVVVRVVNCICVLLQAGLLDRVTMVELLHDAVPFLVHPNQWIRVAVVNFITKIDECWTMADNYCKLGPAVKPFLRPDRQLLRLNNKAVILDSLKEPISDSLWRRITTELNQAQTKELVALLDRHSMGAYSFHSNESWFTKIFDKAPLNEDLVQKLCAFSKLFQKMGEFSKTAGMESELTKHKGVIDLSSHLNCAVHRQSKEYAEIARQTQQTLTAGDFFGTDDENVAPNVQSHCRTSVARAQLDDLLDHMNEVATQNRGRSRYNRNEGVYQPYAGASGTMLTHLHDHSKKITKLALHGNGERFASSSMDGSVRLWNTRATQGDGYGAIKRDVSYVYKEGVAINNVAWAGNQNILTMACSDGNLLWTDFSIGPKILSEVQLTETDGAAQELIVSNHIAYVRTLHGVLYCFDVRVGRGSNSKKHEVWRREVSKSYGLITSFCIDPFREVWMALMSKNRDFLLWDVRYQMEVMSGKFEREATPHRIYANPLSSDESPEVFVSMEIKGRSDAIGVYSLQANASRCSSFHGYREEEKKPLEFSVRLENSEEPRNMASAVAVCTEARVLYSGDAMGSLRRWDLDRPALSEYICGPHKTNEADHSMYFEAERVGSTSSAVIREKRRNRPPKYVMPALSKPATYHRSPITDLITLPGGLLASASADGVIKIWK